MEENYRPESCPISIPTGSRFDLLDRYLDRFRDGVIRPQLDRLQDSPQMRFIHSPVEGGLEARLLVEQGI